MTSETLCLPANRAWLEKYFFKMVILSAVSAILFFGGSYLLITDFLGDYSTFTAPKRDGRGAAIALGILGAYYSIKMLENYARLKKIAHCFLEAGSNGINGYLTDWTILWETIESIDYDSESDEVKIKFNNTIDVYNLIGQTNKKQFIKMKAEHLALSSEEAEELIGCLNSLLSEHTK